MTKPAHDTGATSETSKSENAVSEHGVSAERIRKLEARVAHLEAELRRLSAQQSEFQHELTERVELD